ncbi:hypothetical protein [Mycolicibacterium moriokaense]|uniref:Uncharacterized protein n=1 Tax=Mycolicibacterium moriokaense TaxID=39691 RepID=A0A318HE65_9MYCO|nr:hypothetical protein [Mycolicibacterium moriokaense]PXX07236.1 hypothetical protein C8E89_11119 [Mycolicibacterium moriokaense]
MNTHLTPTKRRGVKLVGAVLAGAAVAAAALTVTFDSNNSGHANVLAGSGNAPTNTVYVQPTVGAMNMGATATFTTPSSLPQVTEAVPPVKAG